MLSALTLPRAVNVFPVPQIVTLAFKPMFTSVIVVVKTPAVVVPVSTEISPAPAPVPNRTSPEVEIKLLPVTFPDAVSRPVGSENVKFAVAPNAVPPSLN